VNRRAFITAAVAAIVGRDRLQSLTQRHCYIGLDLASTSDLTALVEIRYTANNIEYLEYRQFEIEEIARIFNVPMHLLGPIPQPRPS
jgi:phage terminase large subunit-like protein